MITLLSFLIHLIFSAQSAEVMQVVAKEQNQSYWFEVTIKSPDEGCDQYADWWEIIDEQENMLYRRILMHSHVSEQPFTRSGGPLKLAPDKVIIIRAHMNNLGYGENVMKGSIKNGFKSASISGNFAKHLASTEPLPPECRF